MTDDTKERKWAEAQFKKEERAIEGAKAMSEYKAEREAERAKTERLKALRLAKEASDEIAIGRGCSNEFECHERGRPGRKRTALHLANSR